MKTLQIQIPEGFLVDSFDQKTGEIKFKPTPKAVTDRIKTIADVLADHNLTQEEFDEECLGMEPDEVAYRLLVMLAKSLNEGWRPDWNDHSESKYYPWFEMGGSSGFRFDACDLWYTNSNVGSRLCYKTRELAEHAGKNFLEVYERFMVIK
jgi:hypothetical protein